MLEYLKTVNQISQVEVEIYQLLLRTQCVISLLFEKACIWQAGHEAGLMKHSYTAGGNRCEIRVGNPVKVVVETTPNKR